MMKEESDKLNLADSKTDKEGNDPPGYPIYPDGEDIYTNFQEGKIKNQ